MSDDDVLEAAIDRFTEASGAVVQHSQTQDHLSNLAIGAGLICALAAIVYAESRGHYGRAAVLIDQWATIVTDEIRAFRTGEERSEGNAEW